MHADFGNTGSSRLIRLEDSGCMPPVILCRKSIDAGCIMDAIEANPALFLPEEQAGFCFSPLVCFGRDVTIEEMPDAFQNLFLMSPYGYLVVVAACSGEKQNILQDACRLAASLSVSSCTALNCIAEDYKGHSITDLMTEHGYADAGDADLFELSINHNLAHSRFMYIALCGSSSPNDTEYPATPFAISALSVQAYAQSSHTLAVVSLTRLNRTINNI